MENNFKPRVMLSKLGYYLTTVSNVNEYIFLLVVREFHDLGDL